MAQNSNQSLQNLSLTLKKINKELDHFDELISQIFDEQSLVNLDEQLEK